MAPEFPHPPDNRRTALSLALLLLLIAVGFAFVSNWQLDAHRERQMRETEQSLSTQAAGGAARLTVWYGALRGQVQNFADLDMLRLFAAELETSGLPAEKILELSQMQGHGGDAVPMAATQAAEAGGKNGGEYAVTALLPRLSLMVGQIKAFQERCRLLAVSVLNTAGQPYLTVKGAPTLTQGMRDVVSVAAKRRGPLVLPVRRQEGDLVMDVVFPVYAPSYHPAGDTVVALLMVRCSVLDAVRGVTRPGVDGIHGSCVLQVLPDGLQMLDPDVATLPPPFAGDWRVEGDSLPFARRAWTTTTGERIDVYGMGVPVPDLPWFVVPIVSSARVDEEYASHRRNVVTVVCLATLTAAILMVALWWWLVGLRERAVADQFRRLFTVVNQQKQIIDGVNAALSAGIVLNDLDGVIYYANQGFAQMVDMSLEELGGLSHASLPRDFARSLANHTLAVNDSEKMASFTENLSVDGNVRHFLTSCSPFRTEEGQMAGVVSVYSDITEVSESQRRTKRMVDQTVEVFVRAVEAVDPYLCGQSSYTAALAEVLARYLDVGDEATLATLSTSAKLSQVGMIQLPRDLLTKTGHLTPEERARMQQHVEYARRALEGIAFDLPILETISQMYEKMDGSGYPEGLKGDEIGMNARILAASNAFCAMMRPRSYRSAHDVNSALAVMAQQPLKYDMNVLKALQAYLQTEDGKDFLLRLRTGVTIEA